MTMRFLSLCLALLCAASGPLYAQQGPLRIEITEGVIEPLPFAVPSFQPESAEAGQLANDIARVVSDDLIGTGLFREIPASAFISTVSDFNAPVQYADWKAINAQALVTGAVNVQGNSVNVKFRLYDVFSGAELGSGLQFSGTIEGWRRMAHKVADAVYAGSPAKAAISTAGWSMFPKPGPRTTGKSGWRSWITTAPMCST